MVDCDQDAHYDSSGELIGSFGNPVSGAAQYTTNSTFENCIALHSHIGGGSIDNTYLAHYYNCVWWDITTMGTSNSLFFLRGSSGTYVNCTFGNASNYGTGSGVFFYDITKGTIHDSILYSFVGSGAALASAIGSSLINDYNCLFANSTNYNGATPGAHDITTNSPIWSVSNSSGAIKYIPRTETGNSLSTVGSSGGQIGHGAMNIVGTSGTLYGEAGWNSDTGVSMWPFPNEDLIKTQMTAYSSGAITGARGFCTGTSMDGSPQTLTKYIWEYLGNQIPASIYNSTTSVVTATASVNISSGTAPLSVSFTGTASTSSGTITGYLWAFGDNVSTTTQNPSHVYSSPGSYTALLTATDSNNATGQSGVGITVSAAQQSNVSATLQNLRISGGVTIR